MLTKRPQDMLPRRRTDNNPLSVQQAMSQIYDYVPSFVLANGLSDYDLKAQQAASFLNVPNVRYFEIHNDQDISIKFNSTDMPSIELSAFDSPYVVKDILLITDAYLSNDSGAAANIKVLAI